MTEIAIGSLGRSRAESDFEVVERKGCGHPDTLADALAETLSRTYAEFTVARYGAVLHHQFDKVGILGGAADVAFGGGRLSRPVRLLISGRATARFADDTIPVDDLLVTTAREFFTSRYPMLDPDRDLRFIMEVSQSASPGALASGQGHRARWFHPRSLEDLPNHTDPRCNDTSSGCGYAPLTPVERLVLGVEDRLDGGFRPDRPQWLGTDIKVMAVRRGRHVDVTVAVPQISAHVASAADYRENMDWVTDRLDAYVREFAELDVTVRMNTRDDYDVPELYLTFTGSSIEAGDEGLVGRGNRMGGLISSNRPYTMEGISGKNPVYHTGKMYCVAATEIANGIASMTGIGAELVLVGQAGRRLSDPWQVLVTLDGDVDAGELRPDVVKVVEDGLGSFPDYTARLLRGEYVLS